MSLPLRKFPVRNGGAIWSVKTPSVYTMLSTERANRICDNILRKMGKPRKARKK